MNLRLLAKRLLTPLADFVYPPRCLGCDALIKAEDVLCPACFSSLLVFPMNEPASSEHLDTIVFPTAASIMYVGFEFEHDGLIATCIHTMKYRNLYRIAEWLGRILGERIIGTPILDGDPVLIPVPLHKLRRIERGFNQAEHICNGVAFETGLEIVTDTLIRDRYTESQAGSQLNRPERRQNVVNAFTVNDARLAPLRDRPVIVVDDLITTGATICECAAALEEHGISDVRFLAIARPPKEN
jgi:competence protein ComFC